MANGDNTNTSNNQMTDLEIAKRKFKLEQTEELLKYQKELTKEKKEQARLDERILDIQEKILNLPDPKKDLDPDQTLELEAYKAELQKIINKKKELAKETSKLNKSLKQTSKVLKDMANPLKKYFDLLKSVTLEYDKQRAELNKLTGGSAAYNAELARLMNTASLHRLQMGEVAASYLAAQSNLSDFNRMTAATRASLSNIDAALKVLGFDNFIENVELSITGLGMTANQAELTQKALFEFSNELGPKFKKMVSTQFGPAMELLAEHGRRNAIVIFQKMAIEAKRTGMQITELISAAKQFDTFERAAEMAGRLNAALRGNYFNALEYVRVVDPQKRLEMLRRDFAASGKMFAQLSYYEQQMVADSLGKSIMETRRLLSTQRERERMELEKYTKMGEKFNLTGEQMKDRLMNARTVSDQFKMALNNLLFAFKPVIDILSKGAKLLADFTDQFKQGTTTAEKFLQVIALVIGTIAGLKVLSFVLTSIFSLGAGGGFLATLGGLAVFLVKVAALSFAVVYVLKGVGEAMTIMAKALLEMDKVKNWDKIGSFFKTLSYVLGGVAALGAAIALALKYLPGKGKGILVLILGGSIASVGLFIGAVYLLGAAFSYLGQGLQDIGKGIQSIDKAGAQKLVEIASKIRAAMIMIATGEDFSKGSWWQRGIKAGKATFGLAGGLLAVKAANSLRTMGKGLKDLAESTKMWDTKKFQIVMKDVDNFIKLLEKNEKFLKNAKYLHSINIKLEKNYKFEGFDPVKVEVDFKNADTLKQSQANMQSKLNELSSKVTQLSDQLRKLSR